MQLPQPAWVRWSDQLLGQLMVAAQETLKPAPEADPDIAMVPYCALLHLGDCFLVINAVNMEGKHSVAVCLLRQAVEALTLIDLGLQKSSFANPLIVQWKDGRLSQGELREALGRHIWTSYGKGLWDEPWSEYFGNLASAVQPYAHYTPQLMGWQWHTFGFDGNKSFFTAIGPKNYDPLKASCITLVFSLAGWTLGRLLIAQGRSSVALKYSDVIADWGKSLENSQLLFREGKWATQLLPHVLFAPGADWRDE